MTQTMTLGIQSPIKLKLVAKGDFDVMADGEVISKQTIEFEVGEVEMPINKEVQI